MLRVPVEELKFEAMKNLQKALIGKDAGKAVVLMGAARSVCREGDALGAKDSDDEEDFMATTIYCLLIWVSRRNQWRRRKVGEEENVENVEEEKELGDYSKSTNHPIIHMFHRAAIECELPALLFQASIFRVFSADLARSRHKHERFVPA